MGNEAIQLISQKIDESRALLRKTDDCLAESARHRTDLVILIAKYEAMRDILSAGIAAEHDRIARLINAGNYSA